MLINFDELQDIFAHAVRIGYMTAVTAYDPVQDRIRETEVERWLKMRCVDKKLFKTLVKKRAIRTYKGKAKNSPIYYSKKDIERALTMARLSNIFTNHELNDDDRF